MKRQKVLSLIMTLLFAAFIFSPAQFISSQFEIVAKAYTNDEITARLTELKNTVYPHKSYWIGTDEERYGGYQCYAFARQLAVDVFGSYPSANVARVADGTVSNGWTAVKDPSRVTLEPGDIIRSDNNAHSAMIWYIEGDRVYVGQCFGSNDDQIYWGPFYGNHKLETVSELLGNGFNGVWKHPGGGSTPAEDQFFDFWGVENGITVSGTYKMWFKQVGLGNRDNSDVNIHIDGKDASHALGTIYQDEGGFYSFELDTTKFSEGVHTIYAVFRNTNGVERWVSRELTFKQPAPTISISNVWFNVTTEGYWVKCIVQNAQDGVARVQFPTWTEKEGQDDLAKNWEVNPVVAGEKQGEVYRFFVNKKDHNNENGIYTTHIYAWDNAGNKTCYDQLPQIDLSLLPDIYDVEVTDITPDGYRVTCKVSDKGCGTNRVQFPTWTLKEGQDDLLSEWEVKTAASGTLNGNSATFYVNTKDHNAETGEYMTHIYAYDNDGNFICYDLLDAINVPDTLITGDCNADGKLSVTDLFISRNGFFLLRMPNSQTPKQPISTVMVL